MKLSAVFFLKDNNIGKALLDLPRKQERGFKI